jgi:hypothetical protein
VIDGFCCGARVEEVAEECDFEAETTSMCTTSPSLKSNSYENILQYIEGFSRVRKPAVFSLRQLHLVSFVVHCK